MTEDETPLHQIAWTRLKRRLGPPPYLDVEEFLDHTVKPHLTAWLRALLLASAMMAVARSELANFTHWSRGQFHWLETYPFLWATFGLILAALVVPRLLSGLVRLWQWNERRRLLPAVPVLSLPILTLLSTIGLIAFSGTSHATASAWLCGMVLWHLLFLQFKTPPFTQEETPDSFQRSYYVDRLIEQFVKAGTKLRRIAILGTWGTGKTVVLKLLREKLEQTKEKNFRVAWVNPWSAKTPEEARALIAQGFEDALGNEFSRTTTPIAAPWHWFSSLTASLGHGLNVDFARLLEGDTKATESSFVARINQRLADRDVTVVLLMDDMERAEPEIIRRFFPIIDRLGAIDHCFFVFAIDPDRVAKAFQEDSRTAEETKGYLDKVFDLQFELPALLSQDIADWGQERINPTDTPKLHAAWSHLEKVLPDNPREALHFINDSIAKEVMFLSRYRDDDPDYNFIGFFCVRLLEVAVPGLIKDIHHNWQQAINKIETQSAEIIDLDDIEQNKNLNILEEACRASFTKFDIPSTEHIRLELIYKKFVASRLPIEWALHNHMRLLTLNAKERQILQEYWQKHHKPGSILSMINTVFPEGFANAHGIACQLIKMEVEKLDSQFRKLYVPSRSNKTLLIEATDTVKRLCNQLQYAYDTKSLLDLACFSDETYSKWSDILGQHDFTNIPDNEGLISSSHRFHILLSDRLSLSRRFNLTKQPAKSLIYRWRHGNRNAHNNHCESLLQHMKAKIREELISRMEYGTLEAQSLMTELSITSMIDLFGEPTAWLPEDDKYTVATFPIKASTSIPFAGSMADICDFFLRELSDVHTHVQLNVGGTNIAAQIKANSTYFSHFWQAAQFADEDDQDSLKFLRDCVENTRSQSPVPLLTAEELNAAFPVPAQAAPSEHPPQPAGP
jgi:hypothetical protein